MFTLTQNTKVKTNCMVKVRLIDVRIVIYKIIDFWSTAHIALSTYERITYNHYFTYTRTYVRTQFFITLTYRFPFCSIHAHTHVHRMVVYIPLNAFAARFYSNKTSVLLWLSTKQDVKIKISSHFRNNHFTFTFFLYFIGR